MAPTPKLRPPLAPPPALPRRRACGALWGVLVLALAPTAAAQCVGSSFHEPFTSGASSAGWAFIPATDVIELAGGQPGAWLHNASVQAAAPVLASGFGVASPFTGDFRARRVVEISLDARTDATSLGPPVGHRLSLLLRSDKGTSDPSDDDYAYTVAAAVPQPGQGWVHFAFAIPSASLAPTPTGWMGGWVGNRTAFRPGVDWNQVITAVDRVEVWWIDPALAASPRTWDVGADNLGVVEGPAVAAISTRNGAGVNPLSLASLAPPVLGSRWQVTLDCTAHTGGLVAIIASAGALAGVVQPYGEVLIDPRRALFWLTAPGGGAVATFALPLPAHPSLCGLQLSLQGVCTGAPAPQLSCALDGVLGG